MTITDVDSTATDVDGTGAAEPLTVPLSAVGSADVMSVGGKGANLGEMLGSGFPVPTGFVVTAAAYRRVIGEAGLRDRLAEITVQASTATPDELADLARTARALIADVSVPDDLVAEISTMSAEHCAGARVAVRSSANTSAHAGGEPAGEDDGG